MKYIKFVEYLDELEKTASRLVITKILGKLIKEMTVEESDKGMYLVLGSLGPDFDNKQFNMAGKMVVRAIAEGSGKEASDIEKKYKQSGDLGELVKSIDFENSKDKSYTVSQIFDHLYELAEDSGEKSQERKVTTLKELLVSVSPEERKYLVRIVLGKLRLGFSEKTIFDALSTIESGDKTLRKELDNVFQIYPDTGLLTKVFKESGVEGLKKIKVKAGVPVVPALCQRLNEYSEIVEKMKDVAVERKYDGTRVQIHFNRVKNEIKTFTRNLEESSYMFPELKDIGKIVNADTVIFDSEAVGYDKKTGNVLSFQLTITRKRKHGVEETAANIPLRFYVFDILNLNGKSLIDTPYFERRDLLKKTIKENDVLVVDEFVRADDPKEVEKMHEQYLKEGYEGAVIKKWDGDYLPGRQGWNWVKIKEAEGTSGKLADTLDLVIMGYNYGKGKRSGFGIGAFLVGLKKGNNWVSVAKVGTGLTDEEFKDLKKELDSHLSINMPKDYLVEGSLKADVWVDPKVVVEVAADELTKSPNHTAGLALRFPRLVRFRKDKRADQSTTWGELETIAKLSK